MVYESNTNTRRENTRQYRVVSNSKGVRWMNLNENLAVTVRGLFWRHSHWLCLKKDHQNSSCNCWVFPSCPGYLQYQQIASINWDKLQTISEDTLTTLANATQQIPGFDGYSNAPTELVMTNLGIPLTGSLAIGFTIGFMRG